MKEFIVGAIAVVALVLGGLGLMKAPVAVQPFGANAGPESFEPFYARQTITAGGNVLATSSVGTATYTAANLRNVSLIQHTAASALTATFPASSTLNDFVRIAGDTRTIYIAPVTTGILFAGGTGSELNAASSTKFCLAGTVCRFDFIRKTGGDIEILMTSPDF